MDKAKIHSVVAPVVVSLFCIVIAANAAIFKTQLNRERASTESLNRQVIDLGAQLDQQVVTVKDLQNSLDAARRDADAARRDVNALRREADGLRASNSDLERRLDAALKAASKNPSDAAKSVTEASTPTTE